VSACGGDGEECKTKLFGTPSTSTGLDDSACAPRCECDGDGDAWQPRDFSDSDIDSLRTRVLDNPPTLLGANPYDEPSQPQDPTQVCGALFAGANYNLETYSDEAAAIAAGASVTHVGECGLCSSLQDLSVYVSKPDLTDPVRACGLLGLNEGQEASRACLAEIGFTEACAQIWYYNTVNTRKECLAECLLALEDPSHLPDGTLNPCIQCDEDKSGPVFKAIAGRTRRGSGLASALCRPCDSVARVDHDYP